MQPSSMFVQFSDNTLQKGLFFYHTQGGDKLSGVNESFGSGACVIDYNNDGWQDIFIVNGSGQNRYYGKLHWWQKKQSHQLYQNIDGDYFRNVTNESGLAVNSWGIGCLAADLNNDGYTDVLITNLGSNLIFKNNGNGTFTEITPPLFKQHSHWSTSACAADFDNDGLLDLYIANYINFDKTKLNLENQSEFATAMDEFFNPVLFPPSSNRLYRNMGNFKFTDITEKSGLLDPSSRSLSVRCQDINNDFRPDIVVANAKGDGNNRLYINNGDASFSDISENSHFQHNSGSRGIAIGDIDNDSIDEILLSSSERKNIRVFKKNKISNTLFNFEDVARDWGLTDNIFSFFSNWGTGLHDFNQDGFIDLFIANGFLTPHPDSPHIAIGQPNQLWLNEKGNFKTVNDIPAYINSYFESSRSAVFADFDNDGDMDIYVSNNNNLGQLLINESNSKSHWLGIRLTDEENHTPLIGTTVLINTSAGIQKRILNDGDTFLGNSDPRLLFGLGDDQMIQSLTVHWPNATINKFKDLAVDRYLQIDIHNGLKEIPQIKENKKPVNFPVKNNLFIPVFLKLITRQQGFESALPFLQSVLRKGDVKNKLSAIDLLQQYNRPESIALIISAISDNNINVATKAVQALCSFEQESSIRWLLATLSDKRDLIRKNGSQCFGFLFHEEEALVHRKYLAIQLLLQLLDDTNDKVKVAAIKALAEAENYRAVNPLIKLLSSQTPKIRAEAARSVGLIREKSAEPLLIQALHTEQNPEVLEQLLIALKRLNHNDLNTIFKRFFKTEWEGYTQPISVLVKTLILLSKNSSDGIYISRKLISDFAFNLIKNNFTDTSNVTSLIPLLSTTDKKHMEFLLGLSKSSDKNIRAQAFLHIIQTTTKNRTQFIKAGLKDSSTHVQNLVLAALLENRIAVPIQLILPLLNNTETTEKAIKLLGILNNQESLTILLNLLKSSDNPDIILATLTHYDYVPTEIVSPYLNSHNMVIKKMAYVLLLKKAITNKYTHSVPPIVIKALHEGKEIRSVTLQHITQSKKLWGIKLIEKILLDTSENQEIRLNLLNAYQHPFKKKWIVMLKIAKNLNDPIRSQVLNMLTQYHESLVSDFFKSLVKSTSSSDKNKLTAMKYLLQFHPDWLLAILTVR